MAIVKDRDANVAERVYGTECPRGSIDRIESVPSGSSTGTAAHVTCQEPYAFDRSGDLSYTSKDSS